MNNKIINTQYPVCFFYTFDFFISAKTLSKSALVKKFPSAFSTETEKWLREVEERRPIKPLVEVGPSCMRAEFLTQINGIITKELEELEAVGLVYRSHEKSSGIGDIPPIDSDFYSLTDKGRYVASKMKEHDEKLDSLIKQ